MLGDLCLRFKVISTLLHGLLEMIVNADSLKEIHDCRSDFSKIKGEYIFEFFSYHYSFNACMSEQEAFEMLINSWNSYERKVNEYFFILEQNMVLRDKNKGKLYLEGELQEARTELYENFFYYLKFGHERHWNEKEGDSNVDVNLDDEAKKEVS